MSTLLEVITENPDKTLQTMDPLFRKDFQIIHIMPHVEGDTIYYFQLVPLTDEMKVKVDADEKSRVLDRRKYLMDGIQWRYQKAERDIRLGRTPNVSIETLDTYMEELANITTQEGYPWIVEWPTLDVSGNNN